MNRKEFSIRSMVLRGIYRGAEGSAIGTIIFSGFFSILIGIPGGVMLVITGFSIGVVAGTILTVVPGMLGGVILGVWLYYDWIKGTFGYGKALLRGAALGGFFALPIILVMHLFIQLPFELNKTTQYFLPFYIGGVIFAVVAGGWTGKRLIKDMSELTGESFL